MRKQVAKLYQIRNVILYCKDITKIAKIGYASDLKKDFKTSVVVCDEMRCSAMKGLKVFLLQKFSPK